MEQQIKKQAELHHSLQLPSVQSFKPRKSKPDQIPENDEENYNFSVLYFAFFAIYVGRTLILPLLPSYGNAIWTETHPNDEAKKLPDDKQGLLAALFYLTYATSGILFGPLSIRIGRKPVILMCIIGITVGFIFQSLAFDYWSLVSARTFSGFFAAVNGITQSYISDVCKPQHVPKYTAKLGTVFGLVWGLGPLFAVIVCSLNDLMLKHVFSDEVESHKYKSSLAFAALFTGIASVVVCCKLRESLPKELRVKWRQNKNHNTKKGVAMTEGINVDEDTKKITIKNETECFCEILSVIAHPDYDDVYKLILNILDLNGERVIKQIRLNMRMHESTEMIANEVITECNLSYYYQQDIIDSIDEYVKSMENEERATAETEEVEFERDMDYIDYDHDKHEPRDIINEEGEGIDFARLYEAMLPERERTPAFKKRLRNYMLCVLFVTIIMDMATAGHATILALLNNGKNMKEGLKWGDFIFGMTWMLFGVSYSLVQFFYVRLQIRFGAFGTGAIGACIKTIGLVAIPLLTIMCKHKLCLDPRHTSTQWIELAIHFPASVLNGIGYGLSCTATQTIISDYSKRYNIRSVGHWLGAWMGCIALGSAGVMALGNISKSIGALSTFYVCAGCSFLSMIIYLVLSFVARDIKIKVDVKQVIGENEKLAEELDKLGLDEQVEASVSRMSTLRSFSQLDQKMSSMVFSNPNSPYPLTPVMGADLLEIIPRPRMSNLTLTDDAITVSCDNTNATVTESVTKSSLLQAMSSFSVCAPMGPFPILPPSVLTGVPMITNKKIYDSHIQQHLDLTNKNLAIHIGGGEMNDVDSPRMQSLDFNVVHGSLQNTPRRSKESNDE